MRFVYRGEAPNGFIEQYGVRFVPGEPAEVTEEAAVRKLLGNRYFCSVEGEAEAPKRRGRQPKVKVEQEADDDGSVQ